MSSETDCWILDTGVLHVIRPSSADAIKEYMKEKNRCVLTEYIQNLIKNFSSSALKLELI